MAESRPVARKKYWAAPAYVWKWRRKSLRVGAWAGPLVLSLHVHPIKSFYLGVHVNRSRLAQASLQTISVSLVIILAAGCAQVNTNGIRRYQGLRLPAPVAVVVHDFEPTGSSIGLDTGRSADVEGGALSSEELAHRREIGRVLADVLAEELDSRGILTSRKSGPIGVPTGSMAIGGQIVTVDEGSRAKRVFIGFGSGKSRLTSAAQLYADTESSPSVVWEYQNTAASGSKPGVLTTLPIGVAVQGVTLLVLVLNGGMSTMGELSSSSTANAKRMADELADAVEETLSKVTNLR